MFVIRVRFCIFVDISKQPWGRLVSLGTVARLKYNPCRGYIVKKKSLKLSFVV